MRFVVIEDLARLSVYDALERIETCVTIPESRIAPGGLVIKASRGAPHWTPEQKVRLAVNRISCSPIFWAPLFPREDLCGRP